MKKVGGEGWFWTSGRESTFILDQPPIYKRPGILALANDWILLVDLKRQLRFPEYIAPTNLRPDIVISSKESKVCVIMELTVPWEERIKEAHERKMLKYAELVDKCKDNGWKLGVFRFGSAVTGFQVSPHEER